MVRNCAESEPTQHCCGPWPAHAQRFRPLCCNAQPRRRRDLRYQRGGRGLAHVLAAAAVARPLVQATERFSLLALSFFQLDRTFNEHGIGDE